MKQGVGLCVWCMLLRIGTVVGIWEISACHTTHQNFCLVDCVIFIMMILNSCRRIFYVNFQIIFPRFHFSFHSHSFIIFHTLSTVSSLSLRVGPIRRFLLHAFFVSLSLSTITPPPYYVPCCCSTSPVTNFPVFITFLALFPKFRKATISFVISVYPPILPNATTRLPLEGFE